MADRFALFVRDSEECKKQKPITRLVLYALASRANETGYCWPSVEQVMSDTGLCRASVFRALTEVKEILTVDAPGYKKSNSYIFPFQEKKGKKGMAADAAICKTQSEGTLDTASVGKTKKLSTRGKENVDNSLSQRLKQSHKETGSLSQRPGGSLTETGGGLSQRPEEERGRIQEVSLSLKLPQTRVAGGSNVDNLPRDEAAGVGSNGAAAGVGSNGAAAQGAVQGAAAQGAGQGAAAHAYDGTTRPKTRADVERIRFWCKAAGLDEAHTTDFLRINRLAHWRQIDATTTVCDLIADFAFKWKKDDPEGYFYFNDKRKGIRRG